MEQSNSVVDSQDESDVWLLPYHEVQIASVRFSADYVFSRQRAKFSAAANVTHAR